MNLTSELTILAGAVMDVSQVHLRAHNIFVDIGGALTAHGRGYSSMKGEQPGHQSSTGGLSPCSAVSSPSGGSRRLMPLAFGSGGGQGYQNLVGKMLLLFYIDVMVL